MTTAFEIACPDDKARHLPYNNLDDAMFDARLCDEECKIYGEGSFDGHGHGPCPGGLHIVRPVALLTGGVA
jgi:hypothetical protein